MLTSDIVPITVFNRGGAAGVFETLQGGPKVVVRNNVPVAVVISPATYDEMALRIHQLELELNAREGRGGLSTLRRMADELGITEADLEAAEDDEIE